MTIEEKAKAYDEALEKAKMSYHTGDYDRDTLEMLEIIFPELKKEGYSEAVRKVIIKLVKEKKNQSGLKGYGGLGWEDILAWLERQGEHVNFLSKIQVGDKVTRNEDGVLVNLSQLNRVAKPEENKGNIGGISANWSEEDEVKINRIVACLENLNVADNDILLKDVAWLKSLRPQNHWKPSDEQIAQLQIVIDTYGNEGICDPILTELLFQLKKIKGEV